MTVDLTSIGNDDSYARVFVRQIEALGRPGDVAFGICDIVERALDQR